MVLPAFGEPTKSVMLPAASRRCAIRRLSLAFGNQVEQWLRGEWPTPGRQRFYEHKGPPRPTRTFHAHVRECVEFVTPASMQALAANGKVFPLVVVRPYSHTSAPDCAVILFRPCPEPPCQQAGAMPGTFADSTASRSLSPSTMTIRPSGVSLDTIKGIPRFVFSICQFFLTPPLSLNAFFPMG